MNAEGKRYVLMTKRDILINERKKWPCFAENMHTIELAPVSWIVTPEYQTVVKEVIPEIKSGIVCHKCKQPGHFSSNCTNAASPALETQKVTQTKYIGVRCSKCKEEGHFSQDCKKVLRQNPEITLKVMNLPDDVTEEQVEVIFSKFGELKKRGRYGVRFAKKFGTDEFSGNAFVTFVEKEEGEHAMKLLNNTKIGHCIMNIEVATNNK